MSDIYKLLEPRHLRTWCLFWFGYSPGRVGDGWIPAYSYQTNQTTALSEKWRHHHQSDLKMQIEHADEIYDHGSFQNFTKQSPGYA